jgi:hypothetical protein
MIFYGKSKDPYGMKTKIKIVSLAAIPVILLAILAACSSCTLFMPNWSPAADPLKSWSRDEETNPAFDKAIKDDYQNYLTKNECAPIDTPSYYEDGTGRHAVKIPVETRDRDLVTYIFIYDKMDQRTKVLKYYNGHTSC